MAITPGSIEACPRGTTGEMIKKKTCYCGTKETSKLLAKNRRATMSGWDLGPRVSFGV